jgi:hypothetical protein
MVRTIQSRLRAGLVVAAGSVALYVIVSCGSNGGAPACNALAACCTNLGGAESSCNATATSGELDDAGCGDQLAMYQANGQCPGGSTGDAGRD